jgi:hypothetical protein
VTISPLEVFKGPAATLPATVVLGIVVGALGNFRCLFIFLGVLVRACLFLGFVSYVLYVSFWFCPVLIVLVMSLGFCSILVLFVVYRYI